MIYFYKQINGKLHTQGEYKNDQMLNDVFFFYMPNCILNNFICDIYKIVKKTKNPRFQIGGFEANCECKSKGNYRGEMQ